MGRRAKYFTISERTQARQARRVHHKESECHKAIRRQQNQLAYRRRKALSESEAKSWLLPRNLPKKLSKAAHFSLPTSPIFRYAAESGDAVQDTDYDDKWLSEFNGPPPYSPQAMLLAQENLISLVDALHGWHLRQQCDFERSRLHRYKTQPVDVMMGEVHSDMLSYLKDWEALEHSTKAVQELGGEIHHEVAFLRSQWAARRCYCLGKDFDALQNGSDAFLCVYVDRWS